MKPDGRGRLSDRLWVLLLARPFIFLLAALDLSAGSLGPQVGCFVSVRFLSCSIIKRKGSSGGRMWSLKSCWVIAAYVNKRSIATILSWIQHSFYASLITHVMLQAPVQYQQHKAFHQSHFTHHWQTQCNNIINQMYRQRNKTPTCPPMLKMTFNIAGAAATRMYAHTQTSTKLMPKS